VLRGAKSVLMESPNQESKKSKEKPRKKRSAGEIRRETKGEGAMLLAFSIPPNHSNEKWQNEWRAMEKFGLFVTSEGCIMPYKYYRKTTLAGDGLQGHKRAVHFFLNQEPDRTSKVNQWGWPCAEEISHLCHNPDCCNPLHLCIEFRWKNWKRNYCGINGACDCGMQPACVRTYTNPETFRRDVTLVRDVSEAKTLLTSLSQQYPFVFRPITYYDVEDVKSKNHNKRKEKEKRHREEHEKKESKKAKKAKEEIKDL